MKQKHVLVDLRSNQEFLKVAKRGKYQGYNKQEDRGASKNMSQPILFWFIEAKKNETKWEQENINKLRRHHHSPSYGILQTSLSIIKPNKPFINFTRPISSPRSQKHVYYSSSSSNSNQIHRGLMLYLWSKLGLKP